MRKFTHKLACLMMVMLCCVSLQVKAQSELTVADSTATNSYVPTYGLYADTKDARSQCIYPANLLTDMVGGTISQITFYLSTPASAAWTGTFQVSVGETDETSLANAFIDADLTAVYTGTMDATGTTLTVEFADGYTYNGGNLVFDWLVTTAGNYKSASYYGVVLTAAGRYRQSASGTPYAQNFLPKATFEYTPGSGGPTCDRPESVEANDVTSNSATINWIGSAAAYNLQYKASSDADWTLVKNLTGSSYQLSNLVSNTAYQAQVQTICGENTSGWKSVSFTTLIGLPFAEHFNASSAPSGWLVRTGQLQADGSATLSGTSGWSFGAGSNGVFDSHAYSNIYGTGCYKWLITPAIPIPEMEEGDPGFHMYFNLALTVYTSGSSAAPTAGGQQDDRFLVLVSIDEGANWTTLREWNNSGSEDVYDNISNAGEEVAIDLSAYAGQTVLLAFYGESTVSNGDNNLHVDDVVIEKIPTCLKPTGLHVIDGSATSSTLPVEWTANSGETAWRLQYKPTADTTDVWNMLDIAANPYTITGLAAFTEYEIRVAAVCTEEDFTDYGKSIIAKTAAVVPFAQSFDTTAMPGEWKRYEALLEDVQQSSEPLVATANGWKVGTQNGVFSNEHLYLNIAGTDTKYWLVSPVIEMLAGYQLTFDLALTTKAGATPTAVTAGAQNDDLFAVLVSEDGGASWEALGTWGNQGQGSSFDGINTEGQTIKLDLSEYANKSILLAFYGESTEANGDNNLHISNVAIDLIPACERPLSITIGEVTGSTASISWDADEEGQWEYGYVANPAADFTPAESDYTATTGDKFVDLSGLAETTDYIFFVRRACGETEKSEPLMKSFKTLQTPAALPYEGDFEETNGWLSFHGNFANEWICGTAVAKTGTHALYISNDNGTTAAYAHSACVVYATKTFYFEETGMYSFSFDWLCNGESTWDYMRVALVPSSVEVEADKTVPTGMSATSLPDGWTALDGGSKLSGVTEWQTQRTELNVEQMGYYKVVLVWKNDGSGGTAPGGAIDNFKISKLSCRMPGGLTLGEVTANSAAFSWNDDEDGMYWEYACVPAGQEPTEFTDINQNSLLVEGLAENTKYKFYLRKDCGDSQSEVVSVAFKTVNPYQITVNEGTSTNSYIPFYTSYVDTHTGSQFITPMERLSDIQWDSIKALTFYSSINEKDFGAARFDVYVGEVDETTMSANVPFTSLTKVASNIALAVEEKMMYVEFDNAYWYQGGNLLVAFDQIEAGSDIPSYWQGVSASSGSARYEYASYSPSSASFLPKMSIDFKKGEVPPCTAPKNFMALDSTATTTSIELVWTPVSPENNWVVRYRQQGAEEWIVVPADKDSLLLEGLSPSTVYEAQVATQCDPLDPTAIGEYSRSITFTTLCEIYSIAEKGDFIEGFEAYQGVAYSEQGVAPICWETGGTTTYAAPHVVESGSYAYVHEGNNALNFCATSSSYAYAVLPQFADSLKDLQISFWAQMESATNGILHVGYVDSVAEFHNLITYPNNTTMTYYESNLSAMPNDALLLAFVWENTGSSYYSCCIDDIKVSYIPSCVKPENVAAIDSLTTSTSVTLTWEAQGAESAWSVLYKKATDSIWNNVVADNDTILLEGLIPSSYYDVRVAAICGVADTSDYSLAAQFVTGCAIISEFPLSENFDGIEGATNKQVLPLCWSAINTCTYSSYLYYPMVYMGSTYSNSGLNALRFYSYYSSYSDYDPQDQYAILPQMEGVSGLRMKFNARKYMSSNRGDSVLIGVMTDPQDTATFEPIQVIKPAAATYEPFEVRFDHYTGAGQYIAIKMLAANSSLSSRGFHIDDIVVEEIPNCLEPTGLAVFDIEEHSAKFTWSVEEGSDYVYAVALASAGEPAEDAFVAATDSMLISGLVDNTDYIVYLRRSCAGSYSASISAAFHTLMAPATAPFADDFEAGNNWMFINGNLTNAWSYGEAAHNGEGTHAIYISNDGGATNAYTNSSAVVVYAVKTFILEEGVYTFRYDWKANGESSYDYLRVALIPDSIELVAATSVPSGLSTTAFPAAWHAIPLDGGEKLNGVTEWQTVTASNLNVPAGAYKVVFLWKDDTSGGSQTPAAIDNFSISKITCLPVAELVVSDITASSATIAWTAPEGQEAWQIVYSADPDFDLAEADPIDVASNPYALADLLTDTLYNVYVRANCGDEDGVSVWSQISFRTAKSCQMPDNLAAADITISSASISWNGYGQAGFNLRYINGIDTVVVPNVESPYALTDLEDATDYSVQVQVACDEENWSEALLFTTLQAPASIPYANDFETKNGWSFINSSYANAWSYGTAAHNGEGTHALYISNNGGAANAYNAGSQAAVFATKLFQFEDGVYNFKYDWKANGESNYDLLCVALVPDTLELSATASGIFSLPAGWTALHNGIKLNLSSSWTTESFDLAVEAGLYKVVLLWRNDGSTGTQTPAAVDNISIKKLTCLKPINLTTSDVYAHSAKLSWSAGEEGQSAWQIALDTIAAFNPDTLSNLIDVNDTSYIFTDLNPTTRYYVYVRANCGEDGTSDWSAIKSFTTTVACPAPTGLAAELTPGDGSIATLTWNAGEAQAWQVEYSLNSNMSDSLVLVVTEPVANLTDLTAEATYYARVKADCGEEDGESAYSAVISFLPTNIYSIVVNDGTNTNGYVPIYGNYVDEGNTASQFIVPAAELQEIMWDSITELTFYSSSASIDWGAAEFEVYMTTTEDATLSALVDWNSLTQVMVSGNLSIADNKMVVTLSDPFQYTGDNLLIGFKQTAEGSFKNCTWYGKNTTGASIGGYGSGNNMTQRNFLPKMTINYVPGQAPSCMWAMHLEVSDITNTGATFSWDEVEDANWEYAVVLASSNEAPTAFAPAATPLVLDNLSEATAYVFYLRNNCGDENSKLVSLAFSTIEDIESLPYSTSFADAAGWKLANDPNAWIISDGELYISNNGATYAYDDEAVSVSFATKLFDFEQGGTYTVSYDWKCVGELDEVDGALDYMRAALVPADVELTAGVAPEGLTAENLPAGWIAIDENAALVNQEAWQHKSVVVPVTGLYRVVFVWINDDSSSNGVPAAIDNLSIVHKDYPTDIEGANAGKDTKALKFIRDNHVYIMLNGKVYNVTGQAVELK